MTKRIFAVVRHYDDSFRKHVFGFLQSMGFELGEGMRCEPGTPNEEAARWVDTLSPSPDLLLLPLHQHRATDGTMVDGVGVALLLSASFARRGTPILMPMSDFAYASSFPRRFQELSDARPEIARLIVPMPAKELGSEEIRARIEELLAARPRA